MTNLDFGLYAHGRKGLHNTDAEASCEKKIMSFTHGFIDDDILFLAIFKKIPGELPRLDYWNVGVLRNFFPKKSEFFMKIFFFFFNFFCVILVEDHVIYDKSKWEIVTFNNHWDFLKSMLTSII